jgi:hypothetical protein
MKKIVVSFFVLTLLLTLTTLAQETITLTTYYPSPFGVYKDLLVQERLGVGFTNENVFLIMEGQILMESSM